MIGFGTIKLDPVLGVYSITVIDSLTGSTGRFVGRQDTGDKAMDALEEMLRDAVTTPGSNQCGPMFWPLRAPQLRVGGSRSQ